MSTPSIPPTLSALINENNKKFPTVNHIPVSTARFIPPPKIVLTNKLRTTDIPRLQDKHRDENIPNTNINTGRSLPPEARIGSPPPFPSSETCHNMLLHNRLPFLPPLPVPTIAPQHNEAIRRLQLGRIGGSVGVGGMRYG
eukprot:CAMPEP_0118644774 /NCGR_PEP_ID=MMETSP0785-20121206/7128_1 /TAXON_ID=91992 /ORGANISM="Bolidomonas pacifica, Strain CCMP 1866" /LENGTH=140 /DNA_ID=CAMNT_0006536575 /DNA_START=588 /DNA_END=1010 /DNA_ORIENTATION=-